MGSSTRRRHGIAVLAVASLVAGSAAATPTVGASAQEEIHERIVTLGSSITEIVFALGAGAQVVGVDDSSLFPEETASLPKVGYYRSVGAEGLLSLRPTLLLATDEAGPPEALGHLRSAGVRIVSLPSAPSPKHAKERILTVGKLLGRDAKAHALVAELEKELATARSLRGERERAPRVLFVFSPTPQVLSVAGRETAAEAIVQLAGAELAMDGYRGYKVVQPEAVIAAAPDCILTTDRTLASLGGPDRLAALPGVSHTRAGKERRVIVMDDLLLLGFGPRTGEAASRLARQLSERCPP